MFKFAVNREKSEFVIDFDVPVDAETAKHEEFVRLSNTILPASSCSFEHNDKSEITRIKGNLVSLMDRIEGPLSPDESLTQIKILNDVLKTGKGDDKQGLQINFHQNSLDTSYRYWSFILNQGHFIPYFFNRLNWYLVPKNEIVSPFPLHVDLEAASTCNMNCPMCYRDQLKETGQMDFDLFKKAVDECAANNVFSIRLSWRGETLTHPRIKEMLAYATARIKNVSFLTNAFYIDEDMIDCFIENKLSYISVSFDGIGDIYESIRYPAKFEQNYGRLADLRRKKEKMKSKLPQVRVCTIWPAIRENPESYTRAMREVADYIVCNPYINFKGPMTIKEDFICQYPWERIVVGFNGAAQCCTGWNADDIILGNIATKSIREMWHSDLMNRVRQIHAEGRRMELNSCANCRHGSQGDPTISIRDILGRRF